MNAFWFSSLLIVISNFGIAVLVLSKGFKEKINQIFAGLAITVGLWGLGGTFTALVPQNSYSTALFWWQVAYTGVILIPVLYTHFIFKFLRYKKIKIIYIYFITAVFLFLNWYDNSKYFIGDLKFVFGQFYWFDWSRSKLFPHLLFYILYYWFLLIFSFFLLLKRYQNSSGLLRNQLKYFIVGSIIGWLGPHGDYLLVFGVNVYPLSNFLVALYPLIITYAIVKYRLMDIRVAITRASLFIAVYTLVLGLPFALAWYAKTWLIDTYGTNWWILPLASMGALATVGPFFYIQLQNKAEARLLREQRRYQNTLKNAAIGMTRIRELKKLLSLITHIVTKTVRINYAGIYLFDEPNNEFTLQVYRDSGRVPVQKLSAESLMLKLLTKKQEPLICEEITRLVQDMPNEMLKGAEADMHTIMASVVVPCMIDQKLTGFIVLGDKLSGQIYTPDDLNVFQVLASQAALAIENAQFYEEAKEMQAQIGQAEKMATIGTMADGLSHQINNRFYALSLIAGDTIDTIKLTDTTNCTPEVREMIRQISSALDRIQVNVMQGGEVVKGILKYTRKGEQGLEPITLDQILDSTIEMVKYKVKIQEIDIIRGYPAETPKIKGNSVQMQEAFFNFIDNAYDAIVERRTMLKEPGYRGKVTVTAKPKGEMLEVVIQDNGMGVKKEDLRKVFTPFFTTKVSSRKGTGLGLYVIRNIITETHGGKIAFNSEFQVGTQFVLELPIAAS